MPTLAQNHRQILAAKPLHGNRTYYRIQGVPGLLLDVRPNGKRCWFVRYQPGGRNSRRFRWYKIGDASVISLHDATRHAKKVVSAVQDEDRDPHAERVAEVREGQTFGQLFEEWFSRHAEPKLARAGTDRIIYRCHIEREFAKTRLSDVKRVEIGRFRDKVARNASALTSNSVVELIGRVLNWGLDEGLVEVNPAARLRKAGIRKPRERVLPEGDIRKFWNAIAAMETTTGEHMAKGQHGRMLSPATRAILRLLLLTGQRRGEVVGAMKSELDLGGREAVWTIPGVRTKNGLLHRLPLCPRAKAEFEKALSASPSGSLYVFPSPEMENDQPVSAEAVTRAMARLVAELKISTVSPHDLRRTVGTEMARMGLPVHVRSLVLNHSPQTRGVTDAVYNRYAYDKEKREAFELWEARLAEILNLPKVPEPPAHTRHHPKSEVAVTMR